MNWIRILLIFLFSLSASAEGLCTHLMGGEITWECQGNGNYIFTLKLYRDCNGNQLQFPIALRVHNHPTVTAINMNLISQTDISPVCNGNFPNIICGGADDDDGELQEIILRSTNVNLPGVPPPQGWIFTFDDCCRNLAIDNLVISANPGTGFTLRAVMYPYNGENASPCFDSSPVFAQVPAIIICRSNPFTYNHNAYDVDKDSLVYSFANPLDQIQANQAFVANSVPPNLNYQGNYTASSPFPGPTNGGSVPATLNTQTGEISFTSNWTGNYVVVICVKAYRCGVLVAEIYREIQVVIINCGVNGPPTITAPFLDPITGAQTSFVDTVEAGDFVSFNISGIDNDLLADFTPQSMRVTASGGLFGAGFTDPNTGCSNPPCATLNPAPPAVLANNQSITFNWQTGCNHIANNDDCFSTTNAYTFVLSFQDDFCPAPSYRIATVTVVVLAPPLTPSPSLRCLEVLGNGDVELTWVPPPDPDNEFNSYHIFSAPSINGPYTVIDSIFNLNQSTYTHAGANADNAPVYYFIRTRTGCEGSFFASPSDTLQTLFLTVTDQGSGQIDLDWNPLHSPNLPTTQLPYQLYKQLPPAAFTAYNTSATTHFDDTMTGCLLDIFYRVEISDASGCVSVSNVDGGPFSNDEAPEPPVIDSVSVNPVTNEVTLSWEASTSLDAEFYVIYQVIGADTVALDTVPAAQLSFTVAGLNPQSQSLNFIVSTIDECTMMSTPSAMHSTMYLRSNLLACEGRVNLIWNGYTSWAADGAIYEVFSSLNGLPYQSEGTFQNSDIQQPMFSVPDLVPEGEYCFVITATEPGPNPSTSTSNAMCFTANVQDLPDYAYLRRATVLPDGSAFSACIIDTASDISYYKVLRAPWPGLVFDTLVTLPIPPNTDEINFTDASAITYQQSYTYKYVLVDKCNNASIISNPGRTIWLTGQADDGYINKLRWNTYAEWDAGVESYTVYKSTDAGVSFFELSGDLIDTSYNDLVVEDLDSVIRFCYLIRAIEGLGNTYQIRDTSWSNVLCLLQKPTIFIPNAFIPQGTLPNNTFKPIGLFEKLATNYEFRIFNRWGEEIFQTEETTQFWDGKYQSSFVPSGIYVYRIQFDLPDGSRFDRRGAVTVID